MPLQQESAQARAQVLRLPAQQPAVPVEMERGLLPQRWAPPLEPAPALGAVWQLQLGGLLLWTLRMRVRAPVPEDWLMLLVQQQLHQQYHVTKDLADPKKTSSEIALDRAISRKKDPSRFARQELSCIMKLIAALIRAMQTQQFSQLSLRLYLELLQVRRLRPASEPGQVPLREWWRPELLQRVSAAQERAPQCLGKVQLRRQQGGLAAVQQGLQPAERAPAGQSLIITTCIRCLQRKSQILTTNPEPDHEGQ